MNQKLSESTELVQSKLLEVAALGDGMPPPPSFFNSTPPCSPLLQSNEVNTTSDSVQQTSSGRAGRRTPTANRGSNATIAQKRSASNMTVSSEMPVTSMSATTPATNNFPLQSSFVDQQTESNHDTALTQACTNGHTSTASALIKRGADIGKWNTFLTIFNSLVKNFR